MLLRHHEDICMCTREYESIHFLLQIYIYILPRVCVYALGALLLQRFRFLRKKPFGPESVLVLWKSRVQRLRVLLQRTLDATSD